MNNVKVSDVCVKVSDVNISDYAAYAEKAVADVTSRKGVAGQFLNWINVLPQNQLNNLDSLFELATAANENGKYTDLAILGIGGSRHTTEAMAKMLNKDSNVHFYSSIDKDSFDRFAQQLDLNKTKFLVVSKSGGTLETTVAYEYAKKLVEEFTGSTNTSERFVAMTDASSEKSNLRKLVDKGEIKLSGFVHDDVGGRFSIFDDATIFTLAYVGVSKDVVKSLLEASLEAQKEFLNSDITKNKALQLAAFNVESFRNGKIKHFIEYFGDAFTGATLWEKQLKNESLKATISTDTNIGPGYLHYNAESDLDDNNKDSFFTFVYVDAEDKMAKAVLSGVVSAYSAQHPVSQIVLSDLDVKTVAKFIELKHFETLYTGNILRRMNNNTTPQDIALNEVLQPNVEKYKKEVKKALQN